MFHVQLERTAKNESLVTCTGELVIDCIENIKEKILEGFKNSSNVILNIDGADSIDFSVLQLFCSAHRKAFKENKKIAFVKHTLALNKIISESGLNSKCSCNNRKVTTCFILPNQDSE